MATVSIDDVREELRLLGNQRRDADRADRDLTERIKKALGKSGKLGMTKTEAAQLLGVHRTTLYRVYDA